MRIYFFGAILGLAVLFSLGYPFHLQGVSDGQVSQIRDGHDPYIDDDIVDTTWSEIKGMY